MCIALLGGVGDCKAFKFGFVVQGLCPCTPPKGLLKKSLWNLQNFQKGIFENAF
jgi:hypothetical protein